MTGATGSNGIGAIKVLKTPALEMDADAILEDFTRYFTRTLGRRALHGDSVSVYQAMVYAVRDRLMQRWNRTNVAIAKADERRVHYLSLEYLMGRLLKNALLNLELEEACAQALQRVGIELNSVLEREHDAGLGNGGLGRLAACFLDSCATLSLPVVGYGIRYQYGMFRQRLENGYQIEDPDPWLREGFPWELERIELAQTVRFGGHKEAYRDDDGLECHRWIDTHDVLAVPYDIPVPGYRSETANTLRLWSAKATDAFDLEEFNAGSYTDAVAAKNDAESITMVLYPNAASENGKELRLRQQYFLASASLKDTLRQWCKRHGDDFSEFAAKNCYQLNDTHPAIAVPELMRLLLDEHRLTWEDAWNITRHTMAYTNHTLLPEALECWPVEMFARMLPRLLEVILDINEQFLAEVSRRWPEDRERLQRMSLIQEGDRPMVRMAYLAIVGSFSVNGVAELHSKLLRKGLFRDFSELWPNKFNNKTNGVTQRRWLAACNPGIAKLITNTIGDSWITDLEKLRELKNHAEDDEFQQCWRNEKLANKFRLAKLIESRAGVTVNTSMLFDVQVKRIHEYKRHLLNVLHAIHLYDRIKRGDAENQPPRAIIIGGKAAPGYEMAKMIIKFANEVARVINADPVTEDRLRLVFIPDYNVSTMEMICPAADLSEQISTAGKEASGTGNMKFMMNGAITIGTLDGANIEIRDAVGDDNFFLFGLTVEEIEAQRTNYNPQSIIDADTDFSRVMHLIESGQFNCSENRILEAVIHAIKNPADQWMTAADFRAFIDAHQRACDAYLDVERWTRMSILNTAASGRFSTDRTMRDYNRDIWHLNKIIP
ncbi:MAG: glycogen/starch/alpha-glucan phosphorylase [Gammaproteobacteria bacterium]|nr:glycogen/starch/alpha-glucan phosphorylase [Gammaproteobacteria bacterium]